MKLLGIVLLGVSLCSAFSDYGDETKVNWSQYPQAVIIQDVDASKYYLGFWASRKYVVGPVDAKDANLANINLQSGAVDTAPVTHSLGTVIDLNSGRAAIYKVCNPPSPLNTQTLVSTTYWDFTSTNTNATFIYAKYPSKELYTRTAGNIPKTSDCYNVLLQGECGVFPIIEDYEVCAEFDPRPDACQHISSGNSYPWLLIDGKLQAFLTMNNCNSDGSAMGAPVFSSVRFSLPAIKSATHL